MVLYLGFIGSDIVNITVGSNVIPYPIQSIKITDKLQSSLGTWIRAAGGYIGQVKIGQNHKVNKLRRYRNARN
jgi:hypothetical protein